MRRRRAPALAEPLKGEEEFMGAHRDHSEQDTAQRGHGKDQTQPLHGSQVIAPTPSMFRRGESSARKAVAASTRRSSLLGGSPAA